MVDPKARAWKEIDLDSLAYNACVLQERLASGCDLMAVVKADAYGHGAIQTALALEKLGSAHLAVSNIDEARELRLAGVALPILQLGLTPADQTAALLENRVTQAVWSEAAAEAFSQAAVAAHGRMKAHIKLDTGMSRLGFQCDEAHFEGSLEAIDRVCGLPGLEVEGIFTHFARADEADKTNAEGQLSLFRAFLSRIKEKTGRTIPVRHCANSAGLMELPGAGLDAVRAGIALYGLWPSEQVRKDVIPLAPALSLYTRIVFIKEIEAGCAVSYGGAFTAGEKMRIATIPVGYADGYARGLSGKGYVLIHGKKAGILGRICMDQFMVDVTHIPEAKEGDRVTLIGRDGREEITMELLGGLSGRFNYEFACCLGSRVPRYYKKGGLVCRREQQNF